MVSPLSSLSPPNAAQPQSVPGVTPDGTFDQTLESSLDPLQQVPLLGTIFRAIGHHPLQILGAAAQGFLAGGPIGAATNAGFAILSDQVSGDTTIVPRTEAMLKAYGPLAGG